MLTDLILNAKITRNTKIDKKRTERNISSREKFNLKKEINRLKSDTPIFTEEISGRDCDIIRSFSLNTKQLPKQEDNTLKFNSKAVKTWMDDIVTGGTNNFRRTIIFSTREILFWNTFKKIRRDDVTEINLNEFNVSVLFNSQEPNLLLYKLGREKEEHQLLVKKPDLLLTDEGLIPVAICSNVFPDKKEVETLYFNKDLRLTNYFHFKLICVYDCMLLDPTRVWNLFLRKIDKVSFLENKIKGIISQEQLDSAVIELAENRFGENKKIQIINIDDDIEKTLDADVEIIILRLNDDFDEFDIYTEADEIFDKIEQIQSMFSESKINFVARITSNARGFVLEVEN